MIRSKQLAFALCLFCGMHTLAHAQLNNTGPRGELLYATHCSACHASEIHWRKQRLVTDWNSLIAQVRKWQASIGQIWSDDEIVDVARYLNALYYDFPMSVRKSYLQDKKPVPVPR
jgi:mono/diheme cytochrome c family protein